MKNEKWKMKNEKWKMKNEKWKMKNEKWKMKNEKCVLLRDTMHAQTNRSSGANKSLPHVRYMHLHKEMLTRSVSSVPSSPFSLPDPVSIMVVVVQDYCHDVSQHRDLHPSGPNAQKYANQTQAFNWGIEGADVRLNDWLLDLHKDRSQTQAFNGGLEIVDCPIGLAAGFIQGKRLTGWLAWHYKLDVQNDAGGFRPSSQSIWWLYLEIIPWAGTLKTFETCATFETWDDSWHFCNFWDTTSTDALFM